MQREPKTKDLTFEELKDLINRVTYSCNDFMDPTKAWSWEFGSSNTYVIINMFYGNSGGNIDRFTQKLDISSSLYKTKMEDGRNGTDSLFEFLEHKDFKYTSLDHNGGWYILGKQVKDTVKLEPSPDNTPKILLDFS